MNTDRVDAARRATKNAALQSEFLQTVAKMQAARFRETMQDDLTRIGASVGRVLDGVMATPSPPLLLEAWKRYARDAMERAALTANAFRGWSDANQAHLDAGSPPTLYYDYDVIMDGAHQPRPCNYILLKILPPDGVTIDDAKRPYIIIDPRAGHGGGIGGFKSDSQVGVALAKQHPVYFVAFRTNPEPGQTLADVCHAEAAFVAEVERRHPNSHKPIVIGNCQAGWATAVMAATHPELTGPIVLNGAPMSYWAGKIGQYPMRYSAGVAGGLPLTLMSSDIGGGVFDGANLVLNFEQLNPGRNWFRKYYDLYRDADVAEQRFVDFERWWGAYYLMTDAEIRWIVENLFVGNYLGKNQAQLDPGVPIDLKQIRVPIICFASEGDNITPPAQALNWILDTYRDEYDIMAHGQRIIYMIHDKVGHLGIFVSSSVAKREHKGMVSVLETIETIPPGLYEMCVEDHDADADDFVVSIAGRTFGDLAKRTGDRRDEAVFAGVARASEAAAEAYETFMRPLVQAAVPEAAAEVLRETSPMRLRKSAFSSSAPNAALVEAAAEAVQRNRRPVEETNPFLQAERLWADLVELGWNVMRDLKEASTEFVFFTLWATPWAMAYGAPKADRRYLEQTGKLTDLPRVRAALDSIEDGGVAAGIVRVGMALARARGKVELGHIERIATALHTMAPFKTMSEHERHELVERQRIIVQLAPNQGLDAVPKLIRTQADRKLAETALRVVLDCPEGDADPETHAAWGTVKAHIGNTSQSAAE